jgi:hypothetical protein
VFEVDGKAFEAHISKDQLQSEHSVYTGAFGGDPQLAKLLRRQLFNKGRTSCGLKFSRVGGRASGDFNTGMGNSLIMLAIIMATMRRLARDVNWDTLVDGDNALLFLPKAAAERVRANFYNCALRISGHEMTLERLVTTVEKIRFGQSAPVQFEDGWRMLRDWRKVISHACTSHHHLREPKHALRFLRGVALCEASIADGVPILWKWTRNLLTQTKHVMPALDAVQEYQFIGADVSGKDPKLPVEPTLLTRHSFERAFSVSAEEQALLEELAERDIVVVTKDPPVTLPCCGE